jgi:hypothetical protein
MVDSINLDPQQGHLLLGIPIGTNDFVARISTAQLFQVAPDPRDSESSKRTAGIPYLEEYRLMRAEVQRLFAGQKAKNVEAFAGYLVELFDGAEGIAPPIVLWTPDKLKVQMREDGTAWIQVPYTLQLIAIDGETQLAARYQARVLKPETIMMPLFIRICHGLPISWARQSFHDMNVLGVQPNAALAIGMDNRDPLTAIARTVEQSIPFFRGRINKVKRQLGTRDPELMTITTLRNACVTMVEGIAGVKHGTNPVYLPADRIQEATEIAQIWFSALSEAIGSSLANREKSLASAPPVMAALGALGNQLYSLSTMEERRDRARVLARELKQVDWTKGRHWEGIAGKFTPKGAFSVGGPKETAYAVYSALAEPSTEGHRRVRASQRIAA